MKLPDFLIRWMIGGKMYDFYHQERTDAMEDIIKNKEKRDELKKRSK